MRVSDITTFTHQKVDTLLCVWRKRKPTLSSANCV